MDHANVHYDMHQKHRKRGSCTGKIPAYAVVTRDTKYVRGGNEDTVFYHYNLNLFALKIVKRSSFLCNMDREPLKFMDTLPGKNIITNFSISVF